LLLWTVSLKCQSYIFDAQHITKNNGLANLSTSSIFKDSRGFIWIGTKYGLNRYDGYEFKLYTSEKNGLIPSKFITNIVEDEQGNLWIIVKIPKGGNALYIFNPKTEQVILNENYFKQPLPFNINEIINLKVNDLQNRIWIATISGELFLYQEKVFRKIYAQDNAIFEHIAIDSKDNIWLSSNTNLVHINAKGEELERFQLPGSISSIYPEKNDVLWITTKVWNSTLRDYTSSIWEKSIDKSTFEPFLLKGTETKLNKISQIIRSRTGFWYVVLNRRFQLFNSDGKHLFDFHNLLKNETRTNFQSYLEVGNQMWFATPLGIFKTTTKINPFKLIHKRELPSDCRGITEDENGNIYFIDGKIHQWQPKTGKTTSIYDKGSWALKYHNNYLWTGRYHEKILGSQLNLSTNEHKDFPMSDAYNAFSIQQSDNESIYYVGHHFGISIWDADKQLVLPFDKYQGFPLFPKSQVFHIHKSQSDYWLATNNGVFLMNETQGVIKHFCTENGDLPFNQIQHIHEDKEGIFWLSTRGSGIIRWNVKSFDYQHITTKDGLANDYIYSIYEDDNDYLWMSSDEGLIRMNKSNFQTRTYTTKDGLPHNEFNFTSHYKTKDGTLYFGGLGGLISFHPKAFIEDASSQTPLAFTKIYVLEGEAEKPTDRTRLSNQSNSIIIHPTDKLIELEFALLNFGNPDAHNYAYKIEGYTKHWTYSNENYIRITNLPYGNYTLKVKGQNGGEGWSEFELALNILVKKPFYLQTWFLILGFLTTIAGIIFVIKKRTYKLEKDKERLEVEVQKRTETISQQAQELQVLNIAKNRFFSNITHEFRTPLTLIIGPLEQLIAEQYSPNIFKRKLHGVIKNAKHLLILINQMLDLSKMESGHMKTEVTRGDIISYTAELVKQFEPLSERKNIRLTFIASENNWETHFDKDKWDKIVYNLLSNAIKFTEPNQAIQLSLNSVFKAEKEFIQLDVKDSGVGIEQEYLSEIFNRFYQADNSSTRQQEGTGIGLALVKELVILQGGEIEVYSEVGKGTTFKVYLPILETEQAIELNTTENSIPHSVSFLTEKQQSIPSKTTPYLQEKLELLIIEDNEDMREYIRSCIDDSKYNITEAVNGQEGIDKAQILIPDLIVSDVMMPKKNGFEVVETIRKTMSTSHIPLILLTARAALESRLKGLERGADAYLTKPFSPQELSIRIQKLIEIRRLLQKKYLNNDNANTKTDHFEQEDEFIVNLRTYILENIDNSKLNGDIIGKYFALSRVQLYRKLKALTNQSISQFVRDIRLQKAKDLINEGKLNMSEIAYQTGFNSLSSFSNIFKKAFGKSPSEM
jgi:signal transduction histidine kinase/DNA-binding response OmpR family regulator/ligand-binding sensor domain-containing protein